MRPWLQDKRAYRVFRQWLMSPYRTHGDGYNQIEHFRAWANRQANHFFDVTSIWKNEYVSACCDCLVIEPPEPIPYLASFSEDEAICQERPHEGR